MNTTHFTFEGSATETINNSDSPNSSRKNTSYSSSIGSPNEGGLAGRVYSEDSEVPSKCSEKPLTMSEKIKAFNSIAIADSSTGGGKDEKPHTPTRTTLPRRERGPLSSTDSPTKPVESLSASAARIKELRDIKEKEKGRQELQQRTRLGSKKDTEKDQQHLGNTGNTHSPSSVNVPTTAASHQITPSQSESSPQDVAKEAEIPDTTGTTENSGIPTPEPLTFTEVFEPIPTPESAPPPSADLIKGEERKSPLDEGRSKVGLGKGGFGKDAFGGNVGYDALPKQIYRKAVQRGFEFTLMVVGESGLGKSTLINSLFQTDLYNSSYPGPYSRRKATVQVETSKVLLQEGGVDLTLNLVDTPGFGDMLDNNNSWQAIIDFIDARFHEHLKAESQINRKFTIEDSRVHACLYFISPNGHGLKQLDVEFMKRLHDKVNIIPLIAKADTLTPDECREFKKTVLNEITQQKIRIFEFPDSVNEERRRKVQKQMKDLVPFAVVGSNIVVESSDGRKVRGRKYPWGVAEVENLAHNDFVALRNLLLRTHTIDLKDSTNNVHYERFRFSKLSTDSRTSFSSASVDDESRSPMQQIEVEEREREEKLNIKQEGVENELQTRLKEMRQKLIDKETQRQGEIVEIKKKLEDDQNELESLKVALEKEMAKWEDMTDGAQTPTKEEEKKKKKGIFKDK